MLIRLEIPIDRKFTAITDSVVSADFLGTNIQLLFIPGNDPLYNVQGVVTREGS
jgi:hypothetical protein